MQAELGSAAKQLPMIDTGKPFESGDRVISRYSRVCSEAGVEGFPV
jgi:hypothetical protein